MSVGAVFIANDDAVPLRSRWEAGELDTVWERLQVPTLSVQSLIGKCGFLCGGCVRRRFTAVPRRRRDRRPQDIASMDPGFVDGKHRAAGTVAAESHPWSIYLAPRVDPAGEASQMDHRDRPAVNFSVWWWLACCDCHVVVGVGTTQHGARLNIDFFSSYPFRQPTSRRV
ncbi:hypothetical protein B0H11DRAFT_1375967 [Mycena galericulata]|nr:hypothetical protein B0H11DRAFT_1375967 [Mycena galericulata]